MKSILLLILATAPVAACSICGDGFIKSQTLSQQYHDAKLVVYGHLKNAKPAADGVGGTTEFHILQILKGDAAPAMILIPRYYPLVGATPPDYLFFCALIDGKPDPLSGLAVTPETLKYLQEATQPSMATLPFFFKHLQSKDEVIAADAFHEFARSPDAAIAAAAKSFDRAKLRGWIADDKVPENRIGLYALLLGLCGTAEDAAWLAESIAKPTPRLAANRAGLHCGLTTLDPARGWPLLRAALTADAPISEKLNLLGCLRYFQAVKPEEFRSAILDCSRVLLENPDLCDQAIDDLRRWQWWDLTREVLKLHDAKSSTMLKRCIVRYALSCPHDEARQFINKLRIDDPKLVSKVEESLNRK